MVKLEQAKSYIKVDFPDEDEFIEQLIEISEIYIDSLVGDAYKSDSKKVKLAALLQLLVIKDMYENRTLEANTTSLNKIAHSILDKLSN